MSLFLKEAHLQTGACMSQRTGNCAGPVLHYAVFRVLLFCEDLLDGALYGESVHKAPELFGGELPGLIRGTRPLEPVPAKKDLSQKEHAVPFEKDAFYAVRTVAAEEEQRAFFCSAQTVIQPDISSESGDPFPKVDPPTAYYNTGKTDSFLKHWGSPA